MFWFSTQQYKFLDQHVNQIMVIFPFSLVFLGIEDVSGQVEKLIYQFQIIKPWCFILFSRKNLHFVIESTCKKWKWIIRSLLSFLCGFIMAGVEFVSWIISATSFKIGLKSFICCWRLRRNWCHRHGCGSWRFYLLYFFFFFLLLLFKRSWQLR